LDNVFNYSQKWHFRTNRLFPLLKYMINISQYVIFHIIPFISPCSYIIHWACRRPGLVHALSIKKEKKKGGMVKLVWWAQSPHEWKK
jgi:hypothetical protein